MIGINQIFRTLSTVKSNKEITNTDMRRTSAEVANTEIWNTKKEGFSAQKLGKNHLDIII